MLLTVPRLKFLAVVWLLVISVLFFLPGSALPGEGIFGIPHFDKYVHFGFFAVLVVLWRFYFEPGAKFTWLLFLLAFCYGLGVELIQHYFVANRAFDLSDVAADILGAIAGLWFWTRRYIKK
jgi:VanZ family protein